MREKVQEVAEVGAQGHEMEWGSEREVQLELLRRSKMKMTIPEKCLEVERAKSHLWA